MDPRILILDDALSSVDTLTGGADSDRLVEEGTHAELIGRGGYYADLCQKQLLEEELEAI